MCDIVCPVCFRCKFFYSLCDRADAIHVHPSPLSAPCQPGRSRIHTLAGRADGKLCDLSLQKRDGVMNRSTFLSNMQILPSLSLNLSLSPSHTRSLSPVTPPLPSTLSHPLHCLPGESLCPAAARPAGVHALPARDRLARPPAHLLQLRLCGLCGARPHAGGGEVGWVHALFGFLFYFRFTLQLFRFICS